MRFVASQRAFTLVEIIVVVSIIAALSGVVYFFASQSSAISRNGDRQADLRRLQAAIEDYKRVHGRYPPGGCPAADRWSGEAGVTFTNVDPFAGNSTGCQMYISGLVPDFIDRLPVDPRRAGCVTDCGYAYTTDADGNVYKLMAMNTVEGDEVVGYNHPFKSCDINNLSNNNIRLSGLCGVVCSEAYCGPAGRAAPRVDSTHRCSPDNPRFQRSYAVFGGAAPPNATPANSTHCASGVCVDETSPLDETRFIPSGTLTSAQENILRMRAVFPTTVVLCR